MDDLLEEILVNQGITLRYAYTSSSNKVGICCQLSPAQEPKYARTQDALLNLLGILSEYKSPIWVRYVLLKNPQPIAVQKYRIEKRTKRWIFDKVLGMRRPQLMTKYWTCVDGFTPIYAIWNHSDEDIARLKDGKVFKTHREADQAIQKELNSILEDIWK